MSGLRALPSVDRLLGECGALIDAHGRASVTEALRTALAEIRRDPPQPLPDAAAILRAVGTVLADQARSALRPVLNLTGTVLHTKLGRALLAETLDWPLAEIVTSFRAGVSPGSAGASGAAQARPLTMPARIASAGCLAQRRGGRVAAAMACSGCGARFAVCGVCGVCGPCVALAVWRGRDSVFGFMMKRVAGATHAAGTRARPKHVVCQRDSRFCRPAARPCATAWPTSVANKGVKKQGRTRPARGRT